ncbi:conserved domain protein [Streptococcus mitis bv. 2 str. SK95]|uniref:Conserved domain protein n=1 Tax=Streptococcus mitis bv. 2 str. SK95 TaxID=1000588 RepID=F9LWX3_STROR|nr:conserved domain protein [Streptococcus mitis bv. 2 str. SK95]
MEDTEQDRSLDDSTFSELLQEEQAINHFYPDERKSPCVHLYHLGENTFVRGGTELEKEEFRKENNL